MGVSSAGGFYALRFSRPHALKLWRFEAMGGTYSISFRWVSFTSPSAKNQFPPNLVNLSFLGRILAFLNYFSYSLSTTINIYGMSWHKKTKIEDRERLWEEIIIVIECLHNIPSMSDKLPNYIYNRIESIIEYVKEKGWD